ncbi:toxin-antitoxin system YwqK family antitoxin [Fusobacterium gastrosuis]|uniref:toxin-antitoxin system YwqK family antitoxin n=1 Tax=Fusobacterium gastrosuis TaxID=1755100 RepID=UPI002AA094AD|nr:hypothetical protein [Fusobacterium gastrosuis]
MRIKESILNFILKKILNSNLTYTELLNYSKSNNKKEHKNIKKEINLFSENELYKNGSIYATGEMNLLEKNGEWKYFFKNGNIQKIIIHDKGKDFLKEEYYESGELFKKHFISDLKEKITETYYITGEIFSIRVLPEYFKTDTDNYFEYIFYINGNLKEKKRVIGNKLVGSYELYREDGILLKKTFYLKDGEIDGNETVYYENGNTYKTIDYLKNVKQGFEKTFFENGQLAEVSIFSKNELVHTLAKFNEKGEKIG